MNGHEQAIIKAIAEILDTPARQPLGPETQLEIELGLDSGHFIELFLILEETIPGFTLGSARLEPEDFFDVGSLARFISRRLTYQEEELA